MPTGDKGGAVTKKLTPAQQRALDQIYAKSKASQRQAKVTEAKAQHVNDKPTPYRNPMTGAPVYLGTTPAQQRRASQALGATSKLQAQRIAEGERKANPANALKVPRAAFSTAKALAPLFQTRGEVYGTQPSEANVAAPQRIVGAIAKSTAKDVTDPRHHKLNLLLDALAFGSAGAGAGGRLVKAERAIREGAGARAAGRALTERALPQEVLPRKLVGDARTGTRRVRLPEGGHVQPLHQSQSIPTAAAQHAFDRLSELRPGLPVVGARARVKRILPEAQMVRTRRAAAELLPLQHAAHKIKGHGGRLSPKEAAYSAVKSFGHGPEGLRLLSADIARREARLQALPRLIVEQRARVASATPSRVKAAENRLAALQHELNVSQPAIVKAWKAAHPIVSNLDKHPDLQRALGLGEAASKATTASRVARGKIKAQTGEQAVNRHARLAMGAKYEKVPAAKGRVEQVREYQGRSKTVTRKITRKEAQQRLAVLDKKYEQAIAKIVPHVNQYADTKAMRAEQLRRNRSAGGQLVGGKRHAQQTTVTNEVRAAAEERLLALAEKHPGQKFAKEIVERDRLRNVLNEHALPTSEKTPSLGTVTETIAGKPRKVRLREVKAQRAGGGLVGAEDVKAGPGAFYAPDTEKRGRLAGRTRSINPPKDRAHQSTGALFQSGRMRLGPQVTIEDAFKEIRYGAQAEDAKLAKSFSTHYDEATFDPRKHVLLNPEGAKVPRYLLSEAQPIQLESATPREIAEHWLENRTAWARETFPASPELVPPEHRLGLRMIDKGIANSIIGKDRFEALASSGVLGHLVDTSNNLVRASLIYLNPSYIPRNFTGNLAFLELQQVSPFLVARNLRRASKQLSDLSPEQLNWITTEAGGGAARELAHEAQGFLSKPLTRIADVQGAGADRLPRIAAWLYEADRRGYRTAQQIEMLRKEKRLEPVLNEVSEAAQQAMVKFTRAPIKARRIVRRAIFISSWLEGATRYVGRLALDRPLAARGAAAIRGRVEDTQKRVFGKGKDIVQGVLPIGGPVSKYGTKVAKSVNLTSLSPVGQAFEIGQAIKNAATGDHASKVQLQNFVQPLLVAAIEGTTGINTYYGRHYPQGQGFGNIVSQNLLGTKERPAVPLASAVATMLRGPQAPPSGPVAKQPNYIPEHGIRAGLEQAFLGSARERQVNLPAVQAKGATLAAQSLPPAKRAYASVFKRRNTYFREIKRLGMLDKKGRMPAKLRRAFNIEAQRQGMYAHAVDAANAKPGTVGYHLAKFKADVALLRKHKAITPAQARHADAWAEQQTDVETLKHERRRVSEKYYEPGFLNMISDSRRYLEEHGAKGLR